MANWHINAKGEVHPCRAKSGNCRFGGASGEENHFSSKETAELSLAKKNNGFSALGTRRKRTPLDIGYASSDTKAAVEDLLDRGVVVTTASRLEEINGNPSGHSEVDILEDGLKGLTFETLKAGKRPF